MTFWTYLSSLTWYELLFLCITLLAVLLLLGKILRGKTLDWKNKKIVDNEPELPTNLTQHLEVRDYRHCLVESYDLIGKELLIRFKQNGWLSLADWSGYVEEMVAFCNDSNTRFLDEHYYFHAILKRDDLYSWNLILAPVLDQIYKELFHNLKDIMKVSYAKLDDLKKQLRDFEDKRLCEPGQKKCPIFIPVLTISTEIVMEEYIKMPERARTEINRVMTRIIQEKFTHYLSKYGTLIEKEN